MGSRDLCRNDLIRMLRRHVRTVAAVKGRREALRESYQLYKIAMDTAVSEDTPLVQSVSK